MACPREKSVRYRVGSLQRKAAHLNALQLHCALIGAYVQMHTILEIYWSNLVYEGRHDCSSQSLATFAKLHIVHLPNLFNN